MTSLKKLMTPSPIDKNTVFGWNVCFFNHVPVSCSLESFVTILCEFLFLHCIFVTDDKVYSISSADVHFFVTFNLFVGLFVTFWKVGT